MWLIDTGKSEIARFASSRAFIHSHHNRRSLYHGRGGASPTRILSAEVEDCILCVTFSNGTTANQAVAKARDSLMAVHRGFITGESTTAADDFFVGLIFDKLFVAFVCSLFTPSVSVEAINKLSNFLQG
jgi:hypothetical protein